MGLDITVNATVKEVREELALSAGHGVKHPAEALKLLADWEESSEIHTMPGSYRGLHEVRSAYIKIKNLSPEHESGIPEDHVPHHLLNHSDCEGWYIPDDFEEVLWYHGGTVGSSVKLLSELEAMQLERAKLVNNPYGWGRAWDAVYLAAVASVVANQPIRFS